MNYRPLGNTGLQVSELGLGCSSLGSNVFDDHSASSRRVLERAFEAGVTFFDTASTYGYGTSEMLIGEVFQGRRDRVVIATKGGQLFTTLGRYGKVLRPIVGPFRPLLRPAKGALRRSASHRQDFSPEYLGQTLEASLGRLKTDYVDLYQLHSPPTDILMRGDVFDALDRWKSEGKVRFCGVSTRTVDDALLCLRHGRVDALQIPFNLLAREATRALLPEAKAAGVGIVVRVPFGRGLLTEARRVATGLRTDDPRATAHAETERQRLSFLVEGKRRSWIEAALRFILDHEDVATVIPGTKSLPHLEENLKAAQAPPLDEAEMRRIRAN